MIDLTTAQHVLFKQIARNGQSGLHHGKDALGDLIALALSDLIEIKGMKAFITPKGAAFVARVTA